VAVLVTMPDASHGIMSWVMLVPAQHSPTRLPNALVVVAWTRGGPLAHPAPPTPPLKRIRATKSLPAHR
jgi:hypothetical protein